MLKCRKYKVFVKKAQRDSGSESPRTPDPPVRKNVNLKGKVKIESAKKTKEDPQKELKD